MRMEAMTGISLRAAIGVVQEEREDMVVEMADMAVVETTETEDMEVEEVGIMTEDMIMMMENTIGEGSLIRFLAIDQKQ